MVATSFSNWCSGTAVNLVELTAMVSRSIGGSARLFVPVVTVAGFPEHLFFHLFVCSRSLAILGLPGNYHTLREWDCSADRAIESLAILAGAWNHPDTGRRPVRPNLATK